MSLRFASRALLALAWLVAIALLPGQVAVWIASDGRTVLSNRAEPPPDGESISPKELARLWRGDLLGEPIAGRVATSSSDDRYLRALLGARDDVRRGELKRGLRTLRRLVGAHPARPEAAWVLARIERSRGRLRAALDALDSALGLATAGAPEWRDEALALRREIREELRHAEQGGSAESQVEQLESSNFRLSYDHHFAGRDYGDRVLGILDQVRGIVASSVGRSLDRPLDVRVYTRAQYLDAYRHRFGFATVGFYDGAIHVVSARHPRGELLALLAHEYVHAVFEDVLGGHQPFFLNEGLAERAEERTRGRVSLVRGEWRRLLDAWRHESWVPLRSLVRGFGGLEGERALLAYLESRAAVDLLEQRFPGVISRWLARIEGGRAWERALVDETGWDVERLERELAAEVQSRFPVDPLALALPQSSGAQ